MMTLYILKCRSILILLRRNKDGIKITNSPALKFLTAVAHGKPVIIYATEITPPIFPDPTEKCLECNGPD